jgi:DNA-binding CsgD family transcriptional regulator
MLDPHAVPPPEPSRPTLLIGLSVPMDERRRSPTTPPAAPDVLNLRPRTASAPVDGAGTRGEWAVRGDLGLREAGVQVPYPARDLTREDRMVGLLEALQAIRAPELGRMLEEAAAHVAEAFGAGLATAFVYEPEITSLAALGTSPTPLGRRQRALGLDRLPLVNGGRAVAAFRSGVPHLTGRADADPEELRGFVEGLGVQSVATCAIQVNGERRGVLSVASAAPDAFGERDLRALGAVAGWVGLVMERADLVMERADLVQQLAAAAERRGYARAGHELARLTARQRDVAALVADGRTNAEIAARLGLTEGTVANHLEQAMRRLDLRSRSQLAVWAYRHGLYRPDDEAVEPADLAHD